MMQTIALSLLAVFLMNTPPERDASARWIHPPKDSQTGGEQAGVFSNGASPRASAAPTANPGAPSPEFWDSLEARYGQYLDIPFPPGSENQPSVEDTAVAVFHVIVPLFGAEEGIPAYNVVDSLFVTMKSAAIDETGDTIWIFGPTNPRPSGLPEPGKPTYRYDLRPGTIDLRGIPSRYGDHIVEYVTVTDSVTFYPAKPHGNVKLRLIAALSSQVNTTPDGFGRMTDSAFVDVYPFGDPGGAVLRGDMDLSGTWALVDIIILLNHLYLNAPLDPRVRADVNADGAVDLRDLLSLLRYVFKGGPKPPP